MSIWVVLNNSLPCKEKFYRFLTDWKISDKEYGHVLNVWKK